ncbi:MAG: DUF2807 domain-containing protein [Salinivirgaceae bacterium]|nr:DUF2807 domain-containing protein [Salinivirgaceae bacterium]MDD4747648.1 DUF2807 domain-containing protein [Salinivirgaceae bacterium]
MSCKELIIVLFIALFFNSCQFMFKGEGEHTIEEVPIGRVFDFVVNDVFDIYIIPDSIPKLYLEAGENQLKTITTQYDSITGKLSINNSIVFRAARGYKKIKVILHTNTLADIDFTVAGSLYFSDTLTVPTFRYSVHGDMGVGDIILKANYVEMNVYDASGIYDIRGETVKMRILNRGLATVSAIDMQAKQVECYNYSLGDCHVRAQTSLKWGIYRYGDIYQYGQIADIKGVCLGNGAFFIVN